MTTRIEWTQETWNPITGCTRISEGCAHCYAERMSKRLRGRFGYDADEPFEVTLHEDKIEQPLGWRHRHVIFVCSMGDLFHEDVPYEWIDRVFEVMVNTPQHTYQVLTKRPERMRDYLAVMAPRLRVGVESHRVNVPDVLPNLWVGVTAENQARADERIPVLLEIPAAVRFVSLEPLLGPISFYEGAPGLALEAYWTVDGGPFPGLDWVIVGGETGAGARRMDPAWAVDLLEQCRAARTPFFYKGAGTAALAKASPYYRMLDGRTWEQFPAVKYSVGG